MRRSVLLPEPFGPTTATISSGATRNEMSASASRGSGPSVKTRRMCSTEMAGPAPGASPGTTPVGAEGNAVSVACEVGMIFDLRICCAALLHRAATRRSGEGKDGARPGAARLEVPPQLLPSGL
jgi:hypothetical protein